MSTMTDQVTDFTARTQEAVTSAVQTWVDTVQSLAGQAALPYAESVVDGCFDVAQQVLDAQRRFARAAIAAGVQAAAKN
jgi:uncharacterized membrane protein (DUF4010 family)